MDTSELLVELGTEEIPAGMLKRAAFQFAEILGQSLKAERLSAGSHTVWYTPRRIVVGIEAVPVRQEDLVETLTGPPRSVAFDAQGVPTRAAQAFAQKYGIPLARAKTIVTPKGEYLVVERTVKGETTQKILRRLLPAAISKITFPKTMYWSKDKFRFIRPLRWIVTLYQGKVVKFHIAEVRSGDVTTGHRFLGKSRLAVTSLASLQDSLRDNGVLVDPAERRTRIEEGIAREAKNAAGILVDDPALLATVENLNEYPSVLLGSFDPHFLELPQEILITVMREHQKYFSLVDHQGALLPFFLTVINLDEDRSGQIRKGHERVLRARLVDAAFFWEVDRKKKLADRTESLRNVVFQEKLGSYYDKTRRVLSLVPKLAEQVGSSALKSLLEQAAELFKCDLVTEMVREFTDLQGIVGGLYAQAEGCPEAVWRAIYEHYLPKAMNSPSPGTQAGALLSLADRLDTVCGCFSVGLVPSGSKDPFAVRRQGNGILKIILDRRLSVSVTQLIQWSLNTYPNAPAEATQELESFFEGRLRFLLEELGYSYDSINAALAVGFDDPLQAIDRVSALEEMRKEADFLALASNFKRVKNILPQAETGDPLAELVTLHGIRQELREPAEESLWETYCHVRPKVEEACRRHDYLQALRSMASMRQVVDKFFDEVLVMAEDPAVRANRLEILNHLNQLFRTVADISQIAVERKS